MLKRCNTWRIAFTMKHFRRITSRPLDPHIYPRNTPDSPSTQIKAVIGLLKSPYLIQSKYRKENEDCRRYALPKFCIYAYYQKTYHISPITQSIPHRFWSSKMLSISSLMHLMDRSNNWLQSSQTRKLFHVGVCVSPTGSTFNDLWITLYTKIFMPQLPCG